MRAILITMFICFFFVLFGGVIGGFIFLSGLMVGCTLYLAEIIKEEGGDKRKKRIKLRKIRSNK